MVGIKKSGEHICLNGKLFVVSVKEIFMDSEGEFAQNIHSFVNIFTEKTVLILRKSNIQKPVHRLDLPVLLRKLHQFLSRSIPAGIATGFNTLFN